MITTKRTFDQYLTLIFGLSSFGQSARILCIYPVPFHSHQKVFQVITEELARRGHELVVLSAEAASPMENVRDIDIHDKAFAIFQNNYKNYILKHGDIFAVEPVSFWRDVFHKSHKEIMEVFIETPELQAMIKDKSQQFDVILTEACVASHLLLVARFNAPVVLVSSFFASESNFLNMGAPIHPILMPDYNALKVNNLSLWDKLVSAYKAAMLYYDTVKAEADGNQLIRKHFGDKAPTSRELKKNIQLMLMNMHQIWDNNRPVPPSMVYMGALHLKKPKTIPQVSFNYLHQNENNA